jgi:hypothetical protein
MFIQLSDNLNSENFKESEQSTVQILRNEWLFCSMNVVSVIKIFCIFFRLRVEQSIHKNSYKYTKN